jgi:hypothetical protein
VEADSAGNGSGLTEPQPCVRVAHHDLARELPSFTLRERTNTSSFSDSLRAMACSVIYTATNCIAINALPSSASGHFDAYFRFLAVAAGVRRRECWESSYQPGVAPDHARHWSTRVR